MLYIYDDAIVEDLRRSFNTDVAAPVVSVIGPEAIVGVAAQLQEDKLKFPLVSVYRNTDITIDDSRTNFSRMHKGTATVFDNETNMLYYEKSIPVKLTYQLTVLTTNTADMDELLRELMFKYLQMYFLTIKLPYESDRKIRFGVTLDPAGIQRKQGTAEYIQTGHLYEAMVPLTCEGCVLLSYTPVKLRRTEPEIHLLNPKADLI